MTGELAGLQNTLSYRFKNEALLVAALTHRSARGKNNERLEFLGDSILNFVIADILFERFTDLEEGDLSRLRASLVNKDALAEVGKTLGIGQSLYLGDGELKSGGFRRASIIADAFEAIIGAIYLDSDVAAVKAFLTKHFKTAIANLPEPEELKDPKTRLQEYMQSTGSQIPVYTVVGVVGADHMQEFSVECQLVGRDLSATGTGRSRRAAEQDAAGKILTKFEK